MYLDIEFQIKQDGYDVVIKREGVPDEHIGTISTSGNVWLFVGLGISIAGADTDWLTDLSIKDAIIKAYLVSQEVSHDLP